MLTKKKKIIILSVMAVLLVVTGYLNIALNNGVVETSSSAITTANFFTTYRTDRESTRSQELDYYDAIIASASTSQEAKQNAEAKKAELVSNMETELVTEGLIKAKGFEDVIVTNTASNVNVVVKAAELTSNQVAQIVDIVQQQTGIALDYIKIIPVE
ncbi:MAG: SpoIIIAH-like family protein [Clostridiales bacterium]|nr:SpoIIIAH-like family protein [Candidatus Apopatousia equi]